MVFVISESHCVRKYILMFFLDKAYKTTRNVTMEIRTGQYPLMANQKKLRTKLTVIIDTVNIQPHRFLPDNPNRTLAKALKLIMLSKMNPMAEYIRSDT